VRATGVEEALRGKPLADETIAEAAAHAAERLDPLDDIHASAAARAALAQVFAKRALQAAQQRAGGA
jgi:carbon-monoxide dehydrogenase medium subunit